MPDGVACPASPAFCFAGIMTEIWRIKIEKQEKDQGILSVCLIRFSGDDFCIVCDRYPVCDEFVLFAF
jgi:hypothetical protein